MLSVYPIINFHIRYMRQMLDIFRYKKSAKFRLASIPFIVEFICFLLQI